MPASARKGAATTLIRAALVMPISRPVIRNGAVLVRSDRILALGQWREFAREGARKVVDLGETTLLPGLVNAHCHLDYTHMAGHFPPPRVFVDWLKLITESKSGWGASEYIKSWLEGARMLVNSGTCLAADIEALPAILGRCLPATPLRVFSFIEMIGITNRRAPRTILEDALAALTECRKCGGEGGLSPHAPYSTTPALLSLAAEAARQRGTRVCVHVAESRLEYEMFRHKRGAMHDWIARSGRDMSDCGVRTPVGHLQQCRLLGPNVIVAHANYLGRRDAQLLGDTGTHVAHCPRSHHYFGHEQFPLRRLERAGVNICLGTDSLASVYKARRQHVELSMFDEMRAFRDAHAGMSGRRILRMATLNGARALGLAGRAGELSPGAFADLIAVNARAKPRDVYKNRP